MQDLYDILKGVCESIAVIDRNHVDYVSLSLFDPVHKYLEPVTKGKTKPQLEADPFLSRWLLLHEPSHYKFTIGKPSDPLISRSDALLRLNWACGGVDYGLPPERDMRAYMEPNLTRLRHPRHIGHPTEMTF